MPCLHSAMFTTPRHEMRAFAACLLLIGPLMPSQCGAYRPFIATDAAGVDAQEVEIELGYFTVERAQGEAAFTIPRVVFTSSESGPVPVTALRQTKGARSWKYQTLARSCWAARFSSACSG